MVDITLFHKEMIGRWWLMKMKPKSTTKSPRGLLYKRFTQIEQSYNLIAVYNTISNGLFWLFDNEELAFKQLQGVDIPPTARIIQVADFNTIVQYQDKYFRYNGIEWQTIEQPEQDILLLSATFNNISQYQTNKYYYVGSFDFMVKGSIEGTNTQYIKGNILPLTSLNIKHFEDNIQLTQDDLVVVDGHLYSVENPETDIKHQPKDYKIYFATLNSIL